jgi:hypothetical protein
LRKELSVLKMNTREIVAKLNRLDARYLFAVMFVVTAFPLLIPLGIPVQTSAPVQLAYNTIQALPPHSIVLIGDEFQAPSWTELGPSYVAILKHLIQKEARLVFLSVFNGEAPAAFDVLIRPKVPTLSNYKYGVDYVELGFVAGGESALASFALNIQKTVKFDKYGTAVENIPLVANPVLKVTDFALLLELDPGSHLPEYLRQFQAPYHLKAITICYGVSMPEYAPFIQTGQLSGMVASIRGGAEYELLIKEPGIAVAGIDAISTSHVAIAFFLIMGAAISLPDVWKSRTEKKK